MKINKYIILHCADTPNGRHNTVEDIDDWHKTRFNRKPKDIVKFNSHLLHVGYQYVIYIDGTVVSGRAEDEIGAHAAGYNSVSIGICMMGKDKFTAEQWDSLSILLNIMLDNYPDAEIIGHYAVATNGKTCPNFDVEEYVQNDFEADEAHVLT